MSEPDRKGGTLNKLALLLGKVVIQDLLALLGFGALTWKFLTDAVGVEIYVPIVAVMIGFFFNRNHTPNNH